MVLGAHVGTLHFLTHVVYLQRKDREAVDGPCRTFGIDGGVGSGFHVLILVEEIAVDEFHQVGTVLIALVDAAFEHEGSCRIDVRVAYDVFEMPLYRINPVFQIQVVFDCFEFVRIVYRGIHIVRLVIVVY